MYGVRNGTSVDGGASRISLMRTLGKPKGFIYAVYFDTKDTLYFITER